jgi:hypothetical protein
VWRGRGKRMIFQQEEATELSRAMMKKDSSQHDGRDLLQETVSAPLSKRGKIFLYKDVTESSRGRGGKVFIDLRDFLQTLFKETGVQTVHLSEGREERSSRKKMQQNLQESREASSIEEVRHPSYPDDRRKNSSRRF